MVNSVAVFDLQVPDLLVFALRSGLLSLSITAVVLGFSISVFWTILPLYMWDLGFSFLEMAITYISQSLVMLTFSRALGIYADRTGRKKFIVIELIILLAAYITFYLCVETKFINVISIAMFSAMVGLSISVGGGALAAAITTSLGRERVSLASGIFVASDAIGWTLGSFVSGILVDTIGLKPVLLVSILSVLLGLLVIGSYSEIFAESSISFKEAFKAAWSLSLPSKDNLLVYLLAIVGVLSFGSSLYFLVFIIKFYMIVGSKTLYGVLSGVSGILSIGAPYLVGAVSKKLGEERILICTLLIRTLLMALLVFSWDFTLSIIFWLAPLWTIINLELISLTTIYSIETRESEAHAVRNLASIIFMALGDIAGGIISWVIGAEKNITLMSVILGLGVAIYSIGIPLSIVLYKKSNY